MNEVERLIGDLDSPDAKVVELAAVELARRGELVAAAPLLRVLVQARDPVRAHGAAEALSGLRVRDAVPVILDKIEDPMFSYYCGSLVYHLADLDCRAHLDRVAAILTRDGLESCMNALSVFRHRRGPLAEDVRARATAVLSGFMEEREAGGHREERSEFHGTPEEHYGYLVHAYDRLRSWNERERDFPRQGTNRSSGERTPDWTPITIEVLEATVARQVAHLDVDDLVMWSKSAVSPPFRIGGARKIAEAREHEADEAWCLARLEDRAILYDDVQDAFAYGPMSDSGRVDRWWVVGEELEDALWAWMR